jgi:hypothetical protein
MEKSCANCRWGDWFLKREEYLCWALPADEAELCKQTGYGTWEKLLERGKCDEDD